MVQRSDFAQDFDREVEIERLELQIRNLIAKLMDEHGVNRTELGRRLKVSKSYITQLLSGNQNMTLRTVGEVLHELGYRLRTQPEPLEEETSSNPSPATTYTPISNQERDLYGYWKQDAYDDLLQKTSKLNLIDEEQTIYDENREFVAAG
jgi:transcriptional regulator with XRE-family HTH domain